MNSEILCIGNELLDGRIFDRNAGLLCRALKAEDIEVHSVCFIRDSVQAITGAVKLATLRSESLIITGGLGSTIDDITRETLIKISGAKKHLDKKEKKRLMTLLSAKDNIRDYEKNLILKQAFFPQNSKVLTNPIGSASAFVFPLKEDFFCAAFPGVPIELEAILKIYNFRDLLFPFIKKQTMQSCERIFRFFGVGELRINEKIKFLHSNYPDISFSILPDLGEVSLIIRGNPDCIEKLENEVINFFPHNLFGRDEKDIFDSLALSLKSNEHSLSVCESMTGGLLGEKLTQSSGASEFFAGGYILYSNASKQHTLKLPEGLLQKYGPVSSVCAREMAVKTREHFSTDFALSITGYAENPEHGKKNAATEGYVHIGLAARKESLLFEHKFSGNRAMVRLRAAKYACAHLKNYLNTRKKPNK
ncbi:nicotinamide-nucleotide amidohydrolase family protein [Candidatus Riflebacteria bacterium]